MTLEDAQEKFEKVSETEDVGQKRFLMFKAFNDVLSELDMDSVKELDGFDGYLYKISQEFLTSSSTYEKTQKMEKILDQVERKYVD
jgi:hypothetical protein